MFLDDVHEIIQVAFGWTDSHLHRFASGPDYYSDDTEYYLMPISRWTKVRPASPSNRFGWTRCWSTSAIGCSTATTSAIIGSTFSGSRRCSRGAVSAKVVCTHGALAGPAEDCGGVQGYELIEVVNDPTQRRPRGPIAYLGFSAMSIRLAT